MVLLHTPLVDTAFTAHDFNLPNPDGKSFSFADCRGEKGTLIAFICNHCPYVKEITKILSNDCKKLSEIGIGGAFIMSNDYASYPEDAPKKMAAFAKENGLPFPYLIDETQVIAKTYGAVCTPDFFGFDANDKLVWRGNAKELYSAMERLAQTGKAPEKQTPSMGCSIKWRV